MTRSAAQRSLSGSRHRKPKTRPQSKLRASSAAAIPSRPAAAHRAVPTTTAGPSTSAGSSTSAKAANPSMLDDLDVDELRVLFAESLVKIPAKREKAGEALKAVRSYSDKLVSDTRMSQQNRQKMSALYQTADKQAKNSTDSITQTLLIIQKLREKQYIARLKQPLSRGQLISLLHESAQTLPLYVGGVVGHPPPGVGAIAVADSVKIETETIVACFVGDDWILAHVIAHLPNGKYELKDVDITTSRDNNTSEVSNQPIVLPRKKLIPLPKFRADPKRDAHALFPPDAIVLALYPQTTCFYKGVVIRSPATATDPYYIAFEDTTFETGYSPEYDVSQRYVLTYKRMKMPKET